MHTDNPFLNDFSKLMSGVIGTAAGLQLEASNQIKQCFEQYALNAGFVKQADFDALEQRFQLLCDKVTALEEKISKSV